MEYLQPDNNKPVKVVICGWAEQSFMTNILRELDHGSMALPAGSEVVFLHTHDTKTTLTLALKACGQGWGRVQAGLAQHNIVVGMQHCTAYQHTSCCRPFATNTL